MSDELERLDQLLAQLSNVLEVPGDGEDNAAEWTWQKLDQLEASMGSDALTALLRRQGMRRETVHDALQVLERRRAAQT